DAPARGRERAAELRADVQRLVTTRARDVVMCEAASAYLELATVRQSLVWLRRGRESAQAIVDLDIERLKEGRLLPLDILQARLSAARLAQRIIALESRESTVAGQLRLLTGFASAQPVQVAFEDLPSPPERSEAELFATAAAASPELKAAQLEY